MEQKKNDTNEQRKMDPRKTIPCRCEQCGAVITHEDYQIHGGVCFNCCIEGMDFD